MTFLCIEKHIIKTKTFLKNIRNEVFVNKTITSCKQGTTATGSAVAHRNLKLLEQH